MAYIALYRKWRPQVFDDIVGQEHITTTLKNQLKNNRTAHAYLFCGPRGTGKTSTAKIFARALNCTHLKEGNPCNKCDVCRKIIDEVVTDVIEIDAASNNGVDEIRELRENVKFTPTAGKYKVYIIDEVHMLSTGAFNALLKTLEEPPSHVVFILATTEPERLPATILSRCQRYDFRRISSKCICDRLKYIADADNISIQQDALEYIARIAEGGMRDALSIMEQCISYSKDIITYQQVVSMMGAVNIDFIFDMAQAVLKKDTVAVLEMINQVVCYGKDLGVLIKDLISHFRNLLIIKNTDRYTELLDIPEEQIRRCVKQAKDVQVHSIMRIIKILSKCQTDIKWAVQPSVTFEMAMIEICHPETKPDIQDLLERIADLEKRLENIKVSEPVSNSEYVKKEQQFKTVDKPTAYKKVISKQPKQSEIEQADRNEFNSPKQVKTSEQTVDFKVIQQKWKEIMNSIKNKKMSVYTFLLKASPVDIKNNMLIVSINQNVELYKVALEKQDNKQFVQNVVKEITGYDIPIKFVLNNLNDNKAQDLQKQSDIMQQPIIKEAIKLFGKDKVEIVDE